MGLNVVSLPKDDWAVDLWHIRPQLLRECVFCGWLQIFAGCYC